MKIQAVVIHHRFLSFPNELLVSVGVETNGMKPAEIIELKVLIQKPEAELKALSFAEIESLAVARAKELLNLK